MRTFPIRSLAVFALLIGAACFQSFNIRRYTTSTELFTVGLAELEKENWSNAIEAFEKLTFDLPARDTLLPRAQWYLGVARRENDERLMAAQAFIRIVDQFPEDTLADDALWLSGVSYREMWRRPSLDPQYGILAEGQLRLLQGLFPDSKYNDSATVMLAELEEWMARKDFETGMHYVRRRAYDSGIIYLRDVVSNYPNTNYARRAMLELVKIYRLPVINYQDDAEEVCAALRAGFPADADVARECKPPTAAPATTVPPTPVPPTPVPPRTDGH
jgi:outer membrane protein assembly factor BamD